jgi:hypothetical protein
MSEALSLPKALHEKVLNAIVARFELSEDFAEDGGPFLPLISQIPMHDGSVGYMRRFTGNSLFQVVTSSIVVPALQLDSHMVFAFTPSDSAIPHFTVDSVCAGEHHAFHLDLIPRMDLGSQLAYMNEVFLPITDSWERGSAIEGLSRAHLSPRQLGIMSPWMLANRATESAFVEIGSVVDDYLNHWFSLMDKGISAGALNGVSAQELIQRDQRNKFAIFNPDVDPVWQRIAPLVGQEAADQQIATLRAISA